MNLRTNLSVSSTGVELRTRAPRKRLLADRLEHAPLAHKPGRIPVRPVFVGPRHYLRALRAAEMKAWEAGLPLRAE